MAIKLQTIDNYFIMTDNTSGVTIIERPAKYVAYRDDGVKIFLYADSPSGLEKLGSDTGYVFTDLLDSAGAAFASNAALLSFLRINTGFKLAGSSAVPTRNYINRVATDGGSIISEKRVQQSLNGSTAVLSMIPDGTKEGVLYSQKPTDGTGDFTVTRATIATRVNAQGLIETVAANVPRIDYSDGVGSLLVEPQATNLITNSENLQNVSTTTTVTRDYYLSPKGDLSADSYLVNASTSDHKIFQAPLIGGFSTNSIITISVYVKKDGAYNNVILGCAHGNMLATFDLNLGVVVSTQSSVIFASIIQLPNGWYRITNTFTFTNPIGNGYLYENLSFNIQASYLGDGISRFGVWGFQIETGSVATSYIPTVASTVTRAGDSVTNAGNAALFNSEEGVLFWEMKPLTDGITYLSISDGTSVNYLTLSTTVSSGRITATIGVQFIIDVTSDLSIYNKIALVYNLNEFKLYVNGVLKGTKTTAPIYPPNTYNMMQFNRGDGISPSYNATKSVKVFKRALTDAELITLTTL